MAAAAGLEAARAAAQAARGRCKLLTLVLVREPAARRLLLGRKKRGFGEGYWNGFGGKVEPGESIREAAARELEEEAGVTSGALERVGILRFNFDDQPKPWEVHVFATDEIQGEPVETDEMAPAWWGYDEVPFDKMWADDKHWYPLLLAGKKFVGDFDFQQTHTMTSMALDEVAEIPGTAVPTG